MIKQRIKQTNIQLAKEKKQTEKNFLANIQRSIKLKTDKKKKTNEHTDGQKRKRRF